MFMQKQMRTNVFAVCSAAEAAEANVLTFISLHACNF